MGYVATFDIKPRAVHAYGRNGTFDVHSVEVWAYTDIHEDGDAFSIEVFSKRQGKNGPIRLSGSAKEIRIFLSKLIAAMDKVDIALRAERKRRNKR